jgi:SagB-type dehydrogenase family enzyme
LTWREYHNFTKHTAEKLRRTQHFLDWANMPDPFRHYEGVPVLDLPADPPAPGTKLAADGPTFLSQLLFYSAAISASKLVPSTGYRYALRVNPSSGNLHPTEFHFVTRGLSQWPDGLYHYRPSSHMAEQRAAGKFAIPPSDDSATVTFLLTTIAWREAWKYRDRAYRYCLHDMGHAWEALALTARAMGCDTFAYGCFADDEIAQACRLNADEWPMLVVQIRGAIPRGERDGGATIWHGGQANPLSTEPIVYAPIEELHAVTKPIVACEADVGAPPQGSGEIQLPAPASSARAFGEVARARRSALDFRGGDQSITLAQLSTILDVTARPFAADFGGGRFMQLYLYVHRVDGLDPGVYRYWHSSAKLERVRSGDQRVAAAGLSLGQDLAGNACVAFSMIADLDRATRMHGDRGYRYAHFEAGAIGQRLYIAAEALGLGATGIGAFFDDEVHRYLGIPPEQGQVVYHFAIGYPVPDPRVEARA